MRKACETGVIRESKKCKKRTYLSEQAATAKATTEEVLKEFENWEDEVKVLIEVRMTGGLRALF